MLLPFPSSLLLLAAGALLAPTALADSPADLPADTPVNQILTLASSALSSGSSSDALEYYSIAITRDPTNYLTFFKRGATYLSLGRSLQASADFDKCLNLKPGFEGALTQRGKIKARLGDWGAAKKDYRDAGKGKEQEIGDVEEAEAAQLLAQEAEKKQDWEACVSQSGVAILVGSQNPELRRLRAGCRLEKGEVEEAVSDLQQVLKMSPGGKGMEETALRVSALVFFGMGEREKGTEAVRTCLHSDPDSKPCSKLFKKIKRLDREIKKVEAAVEKRTFSGAVKALTPSANGEEPGLINTVKEEIKEAREQGMLHPKAQDALTMHLLELTCNAYVEMNNNNRAEPYCAELLTLDPLSLPGLLHRAQTHLDADDFEAALRTLSTAKEHHGASQKVQQLTQKAQTLLKRSKSKDYYKILGVPRDASAKDIKRAYLKSTKINHPDKMPAGNEVARKAAEKKMAGINEAYEVLKDPELRQRFDNGDDPNDPEAQSRGHGGPFHGSPFGQGQTFQFRSSGGGGGGGGGGNPFGNGFAQQMFNMPRGGGGGGFQFQFP